MPFSRLLFVCALLLALIIPPAWAGSAAESISTPVDPHFFHYDSQIPVQSTITPLQDMDGMRVYRVTFPSPVVTPFPADNTVVSFLFLPNGPGPFPAMIVLHEWLPKTLANENSMCEAMAHTGVAAMLMEEPFSLARRPVPHQTGAELLSGNLPEMVAGLRQTVIDARRCADFLQTQPEIDSTRMGVSGISLGGVLAPLIAGVDHRFTVVLTVDAGSDIADVIWNSLFTRGIHLGLVEHGYTFDDLRNAMAAFEANHWLHGFNPADGLMFNGREDIFIRPWNARDMSKAMGGAPIVWLNTGHYGPVLSLGEVEATGAKFLRSRFFPGQPAFHAPKDIPSHTVKVGLLFGGQEVASPDIAYQVLNFDPKGKYSLDAQITLSGLSAALSMNLNDSKSIGIEFPLFHHRIQPRPFILFRVVL